MAPNDETVLTLLESLREQVDTATSDLAGKLHENGCVTLLEPVPAELPADALAYHLDTDAPVTRRELAGIPCALLDGTLPRSNGVVLGPSHADLCCSAHPCGYAVCPVALAACFARLSASSPEAPIPILDEWHRRRARIREEVAQFDHKWRPRLDDSNTALNLLVSEGENDFYGSIVLDDESYLDEFVDDLAHVLATMGKIGSANGKPAVNRRHLRALINAADAAHSRFSDTGDENLAPRTLHVLDRPEEFPSEPMVIGEVDRQFVLERLSRIVDERYVLIVGKEDALASFCSLNTNYLHTFDQNRLSVCRMSLDEVWRHYLEDLDDNVRNQIGDIESYEQAFKKFVGFNVDSMPYRGVELADFLAKHANALRRPALPKGRYQSSSLDETLAQIVGLEQVKTTIRQLEQYAIYRRRAKNAGLELPAANMHMLFTGNPGTGKTTVARIIAGMLYKIGIIRRNKCVEVSSKQLIAPYMGQTDKQTASVIQSALGGVLFIDEAYSLMADGDSGGSYGKEAIAELVKQMEDESSDLVIIFAGYEREMADFVDANPGLASRIGYTFRFADYTTDQLLEIFHLMAAKAGLACDDPAVDRRLRELFDSQRRYKNFGNGRFAAELLHRVITKHAAKMEAIGIPADAQEEFVLREDDIPTRRELSDTVATSSSSASELLAPLVGIDDLKEKIGQLEKVVEFYEEGRRRGMRLPEVNLHMLFTGNPGTGKTTVARIIARVLFNACALPTDKFIEVEARDLSSIRLHHETSSVERYLKDAMGGVLFIDEAYSLMYTNGGAEIIATLVKAMEDHKGEFCVMLAGYEREMRELVEVNPGLASRIGYAFHFEDYKTEELQQIFDRKVEAAGFVVTDEVRDATTGLFKYFHSVRNFGNGRFVDKTIQEVIARHACRELEEQDATMASTDDLRTLAIEDVPSVSDMCKTVSMPTYEPSDVSGDQAKRRIAIHEMGHAVCRLALTGATDIMLVTIEQEGNGALGYVQHKGSVTPLPTSENLMNEVIEYMGGMAAEQLVLGTYSAGNSSDLQAATGIASRYVARYGMSGAGFVQYLSDDQARPGEARIGVNDLPPEVREAMRALMDDAFAKAGQVISENRAAYDQMVEVLIAEGTISGERILELWEQITKGGE